MVQPTNNACIIQLPSGSLVLGPLGAKYPNGSTRSYDPQPCDNMVVPSLSDYVDQVYSDVNSNGFSSITGQWTVPTAPSSVNGQTIFFWNGLEKGDNSFVLQPVLTFGQARYTLNGHTYTVGGNYWYLASWDVFSNGDAYISSIITVNQGDQITGSVTWNPNGCGTGNPDYKISGIDNTLNQETDLNVCLSSMVTQALSAALEARNLSACNQYPNQGQPTPHLDFTSISTSPSATWHCAITGQQPQCGYADDMMTQVHIHSYPTTDTFFRSHGLSVDQTLPNPWWPPYQSGYEFKQSSSAFDYDTTRVFCHNPQNGDCSSGADYIQEAASGFVPSYAWHTQIYINGAFNVEGDVGRNQALQANFAVNWTPNVSLFF